MRVASKLSSRPLPSKSRDLFNVSWSCLLFLLLLFTFTFYVQSASLLFTSANTTTTHSEHQSTAAIKSNPSPPQNIPPHSISLSPSSPSSKKPFHPNCSTFPQRSWPLHIYCDTEHLHRIANRLQFSNRTLLNYFHMHKTGGVTIKANLLSLLRRSENSLQLTSSNRSLNAQETCYKQTQLPDPLKVEWACNFAQLRNLTVHQRRKIDVILGHQYWHKGCEYYFGKLRQVSYFSVFRHPLPRKLSFFFHFFVRERLRNQSTVTKAEVIQFLLKKQKEGFQATRDAGPNYYASRLYSDGEQGFSENGFVILPQDSVHVVRKIMYRLRTRFAFIGLQTQPRATTCMLSKTMRVFAHAHGVDTLQGLASLTDMGNDHNVGSYPWTPRAIWAAMNKQQRRLYRRREAVDLAIYNAVVRRFNSDVIAFACDNYVDVERWGEDYFDGLSTPPPSLRSRP